MLSQIFSQIPEFVQDAFIDSIKLVPFLFFIFVLIELFENYFSKKITVLLKFSQKIGPVLGAIFAIVPQCGFSIVASVLFIKKFISTGTLIAVYIATSDEAIPILLAEPDKFTSVIQIVLIKLVLAIAAGYLTDFFLKPVVEKPAVFDETSDEIGHERGCCNHEISENKLLSVILHPIKHTFLIFLFILAVCIGLNYFFMMVPEEAIEKIMLQNSILQPVAAGIFGLIPNCAVSVLITMMFLKGAISFGSTVAGLSSGAGLGLLVLLRKNKDRKNTAMIIGILLSVSILTGIIIQFFNF